MEILISSTKKKKKGNRLGNSIISSSSASLATSPAVSVSDGLSPIGTNSESGTSAVVATAPDVPAQLSALSAMSSSQLVKVSL